MSLSFYLDRQKKPETAKAQLFHFLLVSFESFSISFLTLFLNEASKALSWSPLLTSLSLFLLPFGAMIGIFISSHFVSTEKKNLSLMRYLLIGLAFFLLSLSLFGYLLPSGVSEEERNLSSSAYYLYYVLLVSFSSLTMAFYAAFSCFGISLSADINFAEGSKYGHVCIYGALAPLIFSPLAGLFLENFLGYRGYSLLFLLSLPFLLLLFVFTYFFKPFDPMTFHQDAHEKVEWKELLGNKKYRLYLLVSILWIPLIWAGDSLVSNLWTALEGVERINAFNPLSYGFYLAISSFVEFFVIFFNTKVGFGRHIRFSSSLAFIALILMSLSFGIISYFYDSPLENGLFLAIPVILLHALKGVANGLFVTSNLSMLHHILGPKRRRKAVFLSFFIFQAMNAILQLVYPYLTNVRYLSFFVLAFLAASGLILSFFLDSSLLHHPEKEIAVDEHSL